MFQIFFKKKEIIIKFPKNDLEASLNATVGSLIEEKESNVEIMKWVPCKMPKNDQFYAQIERHGVV